MLMKMCHIDWQENIYQKWLFWLQLVYRDGLVQGTKLS